MSRMDPTSIRVLVVDDEIDFASSLVLMLKKRGYQAEEAYSGLEALEKLKQTAFDVILLDLKMPQMDGIATLQEIKRQKPHPPVIVLTGHGTVAAGIKGMQLGAADFIQKPTDIHTLCSVILAVVEKARTNGESAPAT
jgi:two-component system, OmpR family, response regulator